MSSIPGRSDFLILLTTFDDELKAYNNTPESSRRIQDLAKLILITARGEPSNEILSSKIITVLNDIEATRPYFKEWKTVSAFFSSEIYFDNIVSLEKRLIQSDSAYVLKKLETEGTMEDLPLAYRQDGAFMLEAIKLNPKAFLSADKSLITDPSWIEQAAGKNGLCLEYIDEAVLSSKMIELALHQNPLALKFAPASIRNDMSILKSLIKYYPEAIQLVGSDIKSNKAYFYELARLNPYCINFLEESVEEEIIRSDIPYYLRWVTNKDLVCKFLKENGLNLQYIDEYTRSEDLVLAAVSQNGLALQFVKYPRTSCIEKAVSQNGLALQFVEGWQQIQVAEIAVSQNGLALQYIQVHDQTLQVARKAVYQNPEAIEYVASYLKSNPDFIKTVCIEHPSLIERIEFPRWDKRSFFGDLAIKQPEILRYSNSELNLLKDDFMFARFICTQETKCTQYLSNRLKKDKNFLLNLIAIKANIFTYVDDSVKTESFILEAIKNNASVMQLAPECYRIESEKIKEAIKQNGLALEFIKEDLKNEHLAFLAVKNNGMALQFIPESLKGNLSLIKEAIKQNGMALQFVPESIIDRELALLAVSSNGCALGLMESNPDLFEDLEIISKAIENNGLALSYVSEELKTAELCLAAVKSNALALAYIPEELKTPELCLEAVTNNGLALEYVPYTLRTRELDWAAVGNNGYALHFVLNPDIELKLIEKAICQNGDVIYNLAEDISQRYYFIANIQKSSFPDQLKKMIFDCREQNLKEYFSQKLLQNRDLIPIADSFSTNDISPALCKAVLLSWGSDRNLDLHNEDKRSLKDNQHRQKMMQFLFDLDNIKDKNGESLTNNEKIDLFFKCYKKASSKNIDQIERLSHSLIMALKASSKGDILSRGELDVASLDDIVIDSFITGGLIDIDDKPKFAAILHSSRAIIGLCTYAESILLDRYVPSVKEAFKHFLRSIINHSLAEVRHESNSYKDLLTPDQKTAWETGQEKGQLYKEKPHVLIDSEDWQDLFMLGTEVTGSCQRVDGYPQLNKCLLGYGLNGKCRVLCLKETKDGPIKARAVIKIIKKGYKPVMLLEPTYPRQTADFDALLKEFAKERAIAVGLDLYTMGPYGGGDTELISDKDNLIAPFEYEDGNQDPLSGEMVRGITTGRARVLANKVPL